MHSVLLSYQIVNLHVHSKTNICNNFYGGQCYIAQQQSAAVKEKV